METKVFQVLSQGNVTYVPSQKAENGQTAMCGIRLKEFGGKYSDEFACTMFGDFALREFDRGDLVVASLRFMTHDFEGRTYQDVVVENINGLNV